MSAKKAGLPVPFRLVVFDAEATSLSLNNNWSEQIRFTDLSGRGFQSLEKEGIGNYNDIATISHNGFYRSVKKVDLSTDNRVLCYNYTDNNTAGTMTGNPSNVNGLFETIDYTSSTHVVDVQVRTNGGGQAFGFAVRTLCHCDNDGAPNFLNTDSDGDGCPDAVEGGEKILLKQVHPLNLLPSDENYPYRGQIKVKADGTTDGTPAEIVSNKPEAYGVPELVNPASANTSGTAGAADTDGEVGQSVGDAQNAAINNQCKNYWVGGTPHYNTTWDAHLNWTQETVPLQHTTIEFANNQLGDGTVTVADLHLPVVGESGGIAKEIDSLINATNFATVIPAGGSLTVGGAVIGSDTNPNKLIIKADTQADESLRKPNGSLMLSGQPCDAPVFGTVQLYSKALKEDTITSWTDNIVGSPTYNTEFKTQYRWQYFGVPVKSVVANPTFYGAALRLYDETYNGDNTQFYQKWHWLDNNSMLGAFKGYSITQPSPKLYTIKGRLNYCDTTVTMTRQAPIVNGATGNTSNVRYGLGQNLFGNSYTAAIDISELATNIPANVERTVYMYNTGAFHNWAAGEREKAAPTPASAGNWFAIPIDAGIIWNNEIPSMQGFMLKFTDDELALGTGANQNVTIPYASKSNTKPQLAPRSEATEKAPLSFLRINLESRSTRDALWLINQEGTTDRFDNGWDGRKYFGTPTAFIFAQNKDGLMQVNADKTIDGTLISFYANDDTEYELTLIKSNLWQYDNLHLHDLVIQTSTALNADTTYYRFSSVNKGIVEKRFLILNSGNLNFKDGSISWLDAYLKHNETLVVSNLSGFAGQVALYDTAGRMLLLKEMPTGTIEIPINLCKGVYLVNLQADGKRETAKIVVR